MFKDYLCQPDITLIVFSYVTDWTDRREFASVNWSIYELCSQATDFIPPLAINIKEPVTSSKLQLITVKEIDIYDTCLGPSQLKRYKTLLRVFPRLSVLHLESQYSKRIIKYLAKLLINSKKTITIHVSKDLLTTWETVLFLSPTKMITIHKPEPSAVTEEADASTDTEEDLFSDDEPVSAGRKRIRSSTPEIVVGELKRLKTILMEPYKRLAELNVDDYNCGKIPNIFLKYDLVSDPAVYDNHATELDQSCLVEVPVNTFAVNEWVKDTSKFFVKSIVNVDNYWFLITSIDAFVRNDPVIDDCALNDTKTKYYMCPTAKIIRKSGGKKVFWDELIIYFGRLEFLVTGAIVTDGTTLTGFLGSSFKHPPKDTASSSTSESNVYVCNSHPKVIFSERHLRNYSRAHAKKRWCASSFKFAVKNFVPAHPLHIYPIKENETGEELFAALKSFITSKLSQIRQEEHEAADNITYLTRVLPRLEKNVERLMINYAISLLTHSGTDTLPQFTIGGEDCTKITDRLVRSKCASLNKSKLDNAVYLL